MTAQSRLRHIICSSQSRVTSQLVTAQVVDLQAKQPSQALQSETDATERTPSSAVTAEWPPSCGLLRGRRWWRLELRRCWLESALILLRRRRLELRHDRRGPGRVWARGTEARRRAGSAAAAEAGVEARVAAGASAQLGETLDAARCVGQHRVAAVLGGQLLAARHANTLTVGLLKRRETRGRQGGQTNTHHTRRRYNAKTPPPTPHHPHLCSLAVQRGSSGAKIKNSEDQIEFCLFQGTVLKGLSKHR